MFYLARRSTPTSVAAVTAARVTCEGAWVLSMRGKRNRANAPASHSEPRLRWLGLDLLRLIALVMMIEGHVFSTCLSARYQGQLWFRWHRFAHGLTAPTFFFASRLAFGVATFGRWSAHVQWTHPAPQRRFWRYTLLILIALCFQLTPHAIKTLPGWGDLVVTSRGG